MNKFIFVNLVSHILLNPQHEACTNSTEKLSAKDRRMKGESMRTPEQSERRASNINNLDGRLAGKYLENGDPRGGGWRRKVVLSFTLYEVNPISIEEVYSNLGIGDGPRTPFHELHPAVTPRDCTKSIELDSRTGRPIRTVIFDPNGVILEEKKY